MAVRVTPAQTGSDRLAKELRKDGTQQVNGYTAGECLGAVEQR